MINKETIVKLAKEKLSEGMFLVDVTVSSANVINVHIDSMHGITIDECIQVSRNIEGNLDRETEDFELQVSSAGLEKPFKVLQQYEKSIDHEVAITLNNGELLKGILKSASNEGVSIETTKLEKVDGKKKKEKVVSSHFFSFEEIKTTKTIISFK